MTGPSRQTGPCCEEGGAGEHRADGMTALRGVVDVVAVAAASIASSASDDDPEIGTSRTTNCYAR